MNFRKSCCYVVGIAVFAGVFMYVGNSALSSDKRIKKERYDVFIIYSSGTSVKDIYDKKNYEVDAISQPTPKNVNCGIVANKLSANLRDLKIKVRIAEAREIKHHDEILSANILVIGSPAYFSNVSWEIKKMFDKQFHKIYMLREKRLDRKMIAAFATSENKSSGKNALKAIRSVVKDCRGNFGPTMIVLIGYSENQINQEIEKFTRKIEKLVQFYRGQN